MGVKQPSFDTNRQKLGKVLPLTTPFTVIIDASERCNFSCNYCFRSNPDKSMWGYAGNNDIMSRKLFLKVLDQLESFPEQVRTISLSNHGEPLCNPDVPWMIEQIRSRNIRSRISIHTNGSLIKGKMMNDLLESEPDRIVISIQGLTSEAYRRTCGVGVEYDEFVENLRVFYNNKKTTQLCVKIVDVALQKGEEKLFYDTFQPISDRVYIESECDIWKNKNETVREPSRINMNKFGSGFEDQLVCPVIFHTLVVTPIGDVYPCTQLVGQKCLGNVNELSLTEMWNGKLRYELLHEQLTHSVETGACVGCGIKANSFFTDEDLIDPYRSDVLSRLEGRF